MMNREDFLRESSAVLGEIYDMLFKLPDLKLKDLNKKNTVLLIVDMVNGFAREGALMSPRVEGLIPEINRLSEACRISGITQIAFADCHSKESPEFCSYPAHCICGTSETEMVNELKNTGGYELIYKNSTNGFLEEEFHDWLEENDKVTNFMITGNCTDICIQQLAVTLKTWFNTQDIKSRIIVPMNMVDTYDLGCHNGNLMNVVAFYNMIGNGVEVVKSIIL